MAKRKAVSQSDKLAANKASGKFGKQAERQPGDDEERDTFYFATFDNDGRDNPKITIHKSDRPDFGSCTDKAKLHDFIVLNGYTPHYDFLE